MKVYPVGIVGEASYQPAVQRTSPGERARICHEKGNPYDELALRVENAAGEVIGYISTSSWLRRAIHEEGRGVAATVRDVSTNAPGSPLGVVLDVTLTDDDLPVRRYARRDDPVPRSTKPAAPPQLAVSDYLTTLSNATTVPLTCDCGAIYKIGLAGVRADTVLDCPVCKTPNTLDHDTLERLHAEYLNAAHCLLAQAKLKPPHDDTMLAQLAASTKHPITLVSRPPTPPGPSIWKRWFGL